MDYIIGGAAVNKAVSDAVSSAQAATKPGPAKRKLPRGVVPLTTGAQLWPLVHAEIQIGDHVHAKYAAEKEFYDSVVLSYETVDDERMYTVQYVLDQVYDVLPLKDLKRYVPPIETARAVGAGAVGVGAPAGGAANGVQPAPAAPAGDGDGVGDSASDNSGVGDFDLDGVEVIEEGNAETKSRATSAMLAKARELRHQVLKPGGSSVKIAFRASMFGKSHLSRTPR